MRKAKCIASLTVFVLLPFINSSFSQNNYFHYKFLNLQENRFRNIEHKPHYRMLMKKLIRTCQTDTNRINILHIGDSHMQAGFYSNEIRKNLHNYFSNDTLANLGFIFPYSAAETNNPGHYQVESSGNWTSCKAVDRKPCKNLGLSGINLKTRDSKATLKIRIKDYFPFLKYRVKKAEIFCSYSDSVYKLNVNGHTIENSSESHTVKLGFDQPTDTIHLEVRRKNQTDTGWFRLSGIIISRKDHGINYHGIGINGATVQSYLECDLLPDHLRRLQPDWVIVSLGTNEAYNQHFNGQKFYSKLLKLVNKIKAHSPNAWILLTTPGHALKQGKFKNPNNALAREQIIRAANELGCGYWDFYSIMGEKDAIIRWNDNKLTASDKLHLNKDGYQLKANLFFDAFLKSFHTFFDQHFIKP